METLKNGTTISEKFSFKEFRNTIKVSYASYYTCILSSIPRTRTSDSIMNYECTQDLRRSRAAVICVFIQVQSVMGAYCELVVGMYR